MNTVSLNNLWKYLEGLSLSESNRRWLSERLMEPVVAEKPHQKVNLADLKPSKRINQLSGMFHYPVDIDYDKLLEDALVDKYMK